MSESPELLNALIDAAYAPIPGLQYDKCWKSGKYQPDLDCEGCPHRYGCSGYEGGSDE